MLIKMNTLKNNTKNNNKNNNRATNNPYLTGTVPNRVSRMTFGSELKRLLGSPWRCPLTLVLVLGSLLSALGGALDLLSLWLYTVSHHTQSDPRPTANIFECLPDQTRTLCHNVVWASTSSPKRLTLYPWHGLEPINRLEPFVFIGYFALGVLSFVAIGNPNLAGLGRTLKLVAGLQPGGEEATANKSLVDLLVVVGVGGTPDEAATNAARTGTGAGKGPVPRAWLDPHRPEDFWRNHLLLGEYVPRHWESDPGYFWLDKEEEVVVEDRKSVSIPYWLTLNVLRTGLIVVAPPGSGKTASIFKPLRNFMERSRSAGIFYDVKSSENANGTGTDFPAELFNLNFDAALAVNNSNNSNINDKKSGSIKLNIFAGQTPAQAGERLAEALIPDLGGDKAYFSNNAKSAMASIVACFHTIFNEYPSLVQILNYLSNPESLEDLNKRLLQRLSRTGPGSYTASTSTSGSAPGSDDSSEVFRLSTLLRRVINLAGNKTTDTLGNLATALEPLVTDVAARLLVTNPEPGAFTIEELVQEPRLVRMALPVANNPRIYPIIGRLVLAQFTYAVLAPACNRAIFKLIAVDEARFFITDSVANGMAQARSSNAGFALSFQTLTQVRDEILLDNIFANAGCKLVMGKVSDKDAERYSRLFGTIELPYVSHSNNQNQAVNRNRGNSYSRGSEFEMMSTGTTGHEARTTRASSTGRSTSRSSSQGTNFSTRPRRRYLDSEVRELEQRHAIIESSDDQGRQWFAQVVNMDFGAVQRIEKQVNVQISKLVKKYGKGRSGSGSRTRPGIKIEPEPEPEQTGEIAAVVVGGGRSDKPVEVALERVKIKILPPALPTPAPGLNVKVAATATNTDPAVEYTPAFAESATSGELPPSPPPPPALVIPAPTKQSEEVIIDNPGIDRRPVVPDPIKQLLAAINIPDDQLEEIARIILARGRTLAELGRLIEYARQKEPADPGPLVVSMAQKDKYPTVVTSSRKTSHVKRT